MFNLGKMKNMIRKAGLIDNEGSLIQATEGASIKCFKFNLKYATLLQQLYSMTRSSRSLIYNKSFFGKWYF